MNHEDRSGLWYGSAGRGIQLDRYTRVTPAWNDRNLRSLAEHVRSHCLFAHVRAASPGMRVSEVNCHPFSYQRFLWMHNGFVAGFSRIKRRLRESLPDYLYSMIEGTTDSEHVFALFLHLLRNLDQEFSPSQLADGLARTILQLEDWRRDTGVSDPSHCNFAVTDGSGMAAVRYVSNPWLEPISLYFAAGRKYECRDGECHLTQAEP